MLNMDEIIRKRRRELGLTQEQLAQMLGVSGPAVSKWEQGASFPDVTLLLSLARALHTDLNTLMGFRREPEKTEIAKMLTRINETAKAQGIEMGFALAQDIAAEYPDCGALLFGLAATLDGRMMMAGMNAEERIQYSAQTSEWYARAAECGDEETRQAAAQLLASYALNRGNIDEAQEIMARLPRENKVARWPLEVSLLLAKGEKEQTKALLEQKLFILAGDIQQILLRLIQAELDEGQMAHAKALAETTRRFVGLMQMHPYTAYLACLMPALAEKDVQGSLMHLRNMLGSLETIWSPGICLMYDQSGAKQSGRGGHDMLGGILREIEESEEYAFLRDEAAFRQMLTEYEGKLPKTQKRE